MSFLPGKAGDDWLSGSFAHWPDLLRQARIRELLHEALNQGAKTNLLRGLYRVARAGAGPWFSRGQRRQLFQPSYDCSYAVPGWIQPEWARQIGLRERWMSSEPVRRFNSFAQQSRYARYGLARHHVNFENIQAYTESQGVELRHPFHDLRLTTFLMGVPGDMLRRNGERKYLLREAMRGTLPEKVRTRQTKVNFNVPIVEAAMQVFSERNVEQLLCVRMGWVKGKRLREIFDAHCSWSYSKGSATMPNVTLGPVWSVLALDVWLRQVIGL